jgi:GNAT superfamily N-acetyltransferase
VSDATLDALAATAANRGLKLVRSRVRTPGKRRFGKVGLADAAGKPVLGMDAKGPIGTLEEIEEYLRNLDAKDWGASLDVAVMPRKKKANRAARPRLTPANDAEPEHVAPPRSRPNPQIREARPADVPRLVELIHELGHDIDEKSVRKNLTVLKTIGETPLVATLGAPIVGLIGRHLMRTIHRSQPVGRIPILIVAGDARDHGIGRLLVDAVEEWCRAQGCALVEVTSNDRRAEAHAFYRHLGYERSSIRFFKKLPPPF